jgi:hypothetical protein
MNLQMAAFLPIEQPGLVEKMESQAALVNSLNSSGL